MALYTCTAVLIDAHRIASMTVCEALFINMFLARGEVRVDKALRRLEWVLVPTPVVSLQTSACLLNGMVFWCTAPEFEA